MAEEDIDVKIEPENEEEVVVKPEEDKKEDKKDDAAAELKAQYDELKKTAEESKRATEAAERSAQEAIRAADQARREATAARTEVADSQLESITSGLSAAESEANNAEAEWAAAMEKADYIASAKAQRKLADAVSRSNRLKEAKDDLEARKLEAIPPRQQEYSDQFEQSISRLTDPSKQWLRSHKEWATDSRKNAQLTAAHYDAVANDVRVDSPEYFEFVEKKIGLRKDPEKVEVAAHQRRKTSPPVAPVNGGGGGGSNMDDGAVTLTAREAKAAQDGTLVWNYNDPTGKNRFKKGDPLGIQEMARRKREGQKQGLYDKSKME